MPLLRPTGAAWPIDGEGSGGQERPTRTVPAELIAWVAFRRR
jgi:hypothetical protein